MSNLLTGIARPFSPCSDTCRRLLRLLPAICATLFAICASAAPIDINSDPNQAHFILPESQVFADPDGKLAARDLFENPPADYVRFSANGLKVPAQGAYWIKFAISNNSTELKRLWVGAAPVAIDHIDLYKRGNESQPLRRGAKYSNPDWEAPERLNIFPIDLHPGETAEYLLRVESSLQMYFSPRVFTDHSYVVSTTQFNIYLGAFYGAILTLFIFILHLYNSLRDRLFVYYLAYIAGLLLQTAAAEGTIRQLAPHSDFLFGACILLGSLLNIVMGIMFTRAFLRLPEEFPRIDRFLLATCALPFITILTATFSFEQFRLALILCGVLVNLIFCLAAAWRLKQGFNPASYVLVANGSVLVAILVTHIHPAIVEPHITVTTLMIFVAIFKAVVLGCGLSALVDNLNKSLSREVAERTIRESQLTQAQQIARYGDWRWDTQKDQFQFSASALDILPNLPEDGKNSNDFDRLLRRATKRQQETMRNAFANAVKTNQGFDTEFSLLHDDGTTHYYLTRAEFQRDQRGRSTPILIGTIHDITDTRLADIANRENEQRWRELADSTFEAILIYQDNVIVDANQACEQLLGFSPTQLIGTAGESFISRENLQAMLDSIHEGSNEPTEFSLRTRAGETIMVESRSRTGAFNQQQVHIVALRDVTERLQHEQQLKQLGYYDSLTGLANRTLFQERLQHAIDKSKRYLQNHALLFIDLDQFKHVNDSLGHDIGDQLLVEVGRRLKTRVRKVDTVARLGGDEFAILVEDITAPYIAAKVAEEILAVMAEPIGVDEYKLMVTPSIGIALYPTDGDSGTELLRKADTAMYHAKSLGRNNYQFYTEALNEKMVRRMDMESELRLAIERDEFLLHYQPKVDLETGNIVGAEALLRWHSAKFGLVPPDEFIAIAEETGLIWPIGELVLRHACEEAKHWLAIHPAFGSIAVNISGIQFNHSNLVETIAQVVEETGVPPEHIELEITEGAIINNADEAIKVMATLKELGVRLSLDDFGTGYSSLNYLTRFPVDCLKMDRSFIAEMVNDVTGQKVAENIVKLAHDLKLTVVAEGVETEEQLNMIRSMGCDELQGYIFSKPLPSKEISSLLASEVNLYRNRPTMKSAGNL